MDWITLRNKAAELVRKYKYVALVLAIGIFLMVLPEGTEEVQEEIVINPVEKQTTVEEKLEQILEQIEGVGRVEVLLTESVGKETIYQTDEDSAISADSQTTRVETVIVSNSEKSEEGLIRQVNPPLWQGAIVVCQGADRASVQLAVAEAVSNVTGISTDRIAVLKMK